MGTPYPGVKARYPEILRIWVSGSDENPNPAEPHRNGLTSGFELPKKIDENHRMVR
jgi:hypothetical protein